MIAGFEVRSACFPPVAHKLTDGMGMCVCVCVSVETETKLRSEWLTQNLAGDSMEHGMSMGSYGCFVPGNSESLLRTFVGREQGIHVSPELERAPDCRFQMKDKNKSCAQNYSRPFQSASSECCATCVVQTFLLFFFLLCHVADMGCEDASHTMFRLSPH